MIINKKELLIMRKDTFEKAKRNETRIHKNYTVKFNYLGNQFEVFPLLVPLAIAVGVYDHCKNKYYRSLEWDERKAEKLLDRTLPKVLKYIEKENAYYYSMTWRGFYLTDKAPFGMKIWARKYSKEIIDYLENGYHHPKYHKLVIDEGGGDKWLKFEECSY